MKSKLPDQIAMYGYPDSHTFLLVTRVTRMLKQMVNQYQLFKTKQIVVIVVDMSGTHYWATVLPDIPKHWSISDRTWIRYLAFI